ncbi:MAG: type II toxin-antitoxin system RelE/ParE family toxin [Anaerolineales bacterium]|nr:type II toxin-antitoxin system RelE/ParE family toxin [Anaerolineales bacterium]
MEIIETSVFTKRILEMMDDGEYRLLQQALAIRPDWGVVIPGSGGLRKLRWSVPGRGKRGGARIIYYWAVKENVILLLFVFRKNERDDLTPSQIQVLRRIVEEEYP